MTIISLGKFKKLPIMLKIKTNKILLLIHYLLNYVFLSGIRSEITNSDY